MKRLTAAVILLCLIISHLHIVRAEALDLSQADSCILIDSKSGQVIYEKDADRKGLYPASTTKILTAILALEKGSLDQMMTASQAAVNDIGKDGMNIGIMAGEQLRMENLLEALLIRSANETANIIAENICSTRDEFISLMNERAKELGATDTHFVNPCGAHESDHYTTASDMAKIARYAMTLPKFRELVVRKTFQMLPTNKHAEWPLLATTNNLLKYTKNELFKVNGIKTGYTVPAGHCLISSGINEEGLEFISVVLGVRNDDAKNKAIKYSENLLEYGFKNYSLKSVVEAGQVIANATVAEAKEENAILQLTAKEGLKCVLPLDESQWRLERTDHVNASIQAPVHQGDVLGYIEYARDGVPLGKVDLVAARPVEAKPKPKVEVLNVPNTVAGNSVFQNVALWTALTAAALILLRYVLRRVSRRRRSRRYGE